MQAKSTTNPTRAITLSLLATSITAFAVGLGGCASSGTTNAQASSASGQAASAQAAAKPPSTMEWEQFRESSDPNVIIAGMPSEQALDIFAARGGTTVINMRTDEEMASFPEYEESVTSRGLTYVHVPTRGSELGEATYAGVAEGLDAADGPVLLHCASGGRATYAWAMRRIDKEGLSGPEAMAWCSDHRGKGWERGNEVLTEFAASRDGG